MSEGNLPPDAGIENAGATTMSHPLDHAARNGCAVNCLFNL